MPVPDYYQRHKLIKTHTLTHTLTHRETHQIVPAAHLREKGEVGGETVERNANANVGNALIFAEGGAREIGLGCTNMCRRATKKSTTFI